tara:strand:- start:128 stop:385 length:258 start_codon:yes stop_codon:yes gene_type:complete
MKLYQKVGGYDWGLYYVKEEFDKMTLEDLDKLIDLINLTKRMKGGVEGCRICDEPRPPRKTLLIDPRCEGCGATWPEKVIWGAEE